MSSNYGALGKLLKPEDYFEQLKNWVTHSTGIDDYESHMAYNHQQCRYYFELLKKQVTGQENTGFVGVIISDANWITFLRSNHCDITLNGLTLSMLDKILEPLNGSASKWREDPPAYVKWVKRPKYAC